MGQIHEQASSDYSGTRRSGRSSGGGCRSDGLSVCKLGCRLLQQRWSKWEGGRASGYKARGLGLCQHSPRSFFLQLLAMPKMAPGPWFLQQALPSTTHAHKFPGPSVASGIDGVTPRVRSGPRGTYLTSLL